MCVHACVCVCRQQDGGEKKRDEQRDMYRDLHSSGKENMKVQTGMSLSFMSNVMMCVQCYLSTEKYSKYTPDKLKVLTFEQKISVGSLCPTS